MCGSAGSYCSEVESDSGVVAAGRELRAALSATEERANTFRAQFLGFSHLWTCEMQAYLKVGLVDDLIQWVLL